MNFEQIQKNLSVLLAASVVVAFFYLAGFFQNISIGFIYLLSYSDILISVIYIMPILIAIFTGFHLIRERADKLYEFNIFVNIAIFIVLIAIGCAAIWFLGGASVAGASIAFFVALKRPIYNYILGIFPALDKETASNIYLGVFILATAYGQGFVDYLSAVQSEEYVLTIDVGDYSGCRLVRVFSEIVILSDGSPESLVAIKHSGNFKVRKSTWPLSGLKEPIRCQKR